MTAVSWPRPAGSRWAIALCTMWLWSGAFAAVAAQSQTPSVGQRSLDATIQQAYDAAYNLEQDVALVAARKAVAAGPNDSRAQSIYGRRSSTHHEFQFASVTRPESLQCRFG